MHQSFVAPAPNSGAFNFSIFKALLKALHCRTKFMVKSLLKAPAPGGWQNLKKEQQLTWIIWINFLPYPVVVPRELCLQLAQWFQRRIWTHTCTCIHTHNKELLAFNTVHVPVFLHTRTQQLRVAPDDKRTIGPVNAHLISQQIISTKPGYKWLRNVLVQVFILISESRVAAILVKWPVSCHQIFISLYNPESFHTKFGSDRHSSFWENPVQIFICTRPWAKVNKWPWPSILTYLHIFN